MGIPSANTTSGGGSGGSIFISTTTYYNIPLNGSIMAAGGNGTGGGGSGGRISIYGIPPFITVRIFYNFLLG